MKKVFFGIALLVSSLQNGIAQSQSEEVAFNDSFSKTYARKMAASTSKTTNQAETTASIDTRLNKSTIQEVRTTIKFVPFSADEEAEMIPLLDNAADVDFIENTPEKTILPIDMLEEAPQEGSMIYTFVEQAPEYKYGQAALYKWLYRSLRYPSFAIEQGIRGTVLVTFVVEKDGSITDVAVKKGIVGGKVLEEEAIRVIKQMPKWKPGKQNGRLVRVLYTLPVHFKLS